MKVKDLIIELVKCGDPEMPVVLSKDEEGNAYGEAQTVDSKGFFSPTWAEYTHEKEMGEYGHKDSIRAFVIWP
jgi:hypothetical protein